MLHMQEKSPNLILRIPFPCLGDTSLHMSCCY